MRDHVQPTGFSRRKFVFGIAAAGTASLLAGCLGNPKRSNADDSGNICALTPEAVEGPFFIHDTLVRQDIREDRQGRALDLRLQVVDLDNGCQPLPQAAVYVWHCDAAGSYSGYTSMDSHAATPPDPPPTEAMANSGERFQPHHSAPGDNTRFLRGIQYTDPQGNAAFQTIYPGWYTGRAVHIHVKIYLNKDELITTQLYMPQELSDHLHATFAPYKKYGPAPVKNTDDAIFNAAGGPILAMSNAEDGFVGSVTLGVKRS